MVFFDVENTSRAADVAGTLAYLRPPDGGRSRLVAVGNWRVVSLESAHLSARAGADLSSVASARLTFGVAAIPSSPCIHSTRRARSAHYCSRMRRDGSRQAVTKVRAEARPLSLVSRWGPRAASRKFS